MQPLNWFYETVISVKQLAVYGASSGSVRRIGQELQRYGGAPEDLESLVIPSGFPTANQTPQNDAMYKETCCVNMSRNSQIFLNKRNWPNFAPMLLSWRILRKDNSSLHLTMIHLTNWWDYVERILCFEVMRHPRWMGGSVETRRPSSPGGEGLLPSRTLRCGDQDRTYFVTELVLVGSNREWNQQIRNRNVRRDSFGKCWREEYRAAFAKARPRPTPTLTLSSVSIPFLWAKVDRCRTRNI